MRSDLPLAVTHEVRDRCLCLHLQRAARAIGRRFDTALRPVGLTHGQYSLLVSLNRPDPPKIRDLAQFLAMDRTTLTANIKPLERRGLLTMWKDPKDRRNRRLALTEAGRNLLAEAVPIWRQTHDEVDRTLNNSDSAPLKADLIALSFGR
ncbi:MarR family winged helix-turn-helix transcriptional regulator [Aestuariivita sp.]|jgi:DNA-binding MarR family transcriptional regulator|uniref:MarR family winged helix-turn-helix transcriptional regulator n=1 Tax=Aestuariivita sp. TaxID=1872407 RepID=UPI002171ECE7|nr:MarR family winged helix-turn-helix transcriptional regulator [Aestuariivita sp.]MCE8006635.1 winged helix-turn-helix transcriptional regulator [Aestuariivita sp.]